MRRTATTVPAALLAVLMLGGAVGCTGGGDDAKEKQSASASAPAKAKTADPEPAPDAAETSAPPKLSVKWAPKLEAASKASQPSICKDAGAKACTDHITKLTELVYDVGHAIDEADAAADYPKTKAHIAKVEEASSGYVDDGCAGSDEATLGGSACGEHVQWVLLGPATVEMTLQTDENLAGR